MRIPRYIVIKLEMVDKDTVKATEITDRCEIYEYEADEDEPTHGKMLICPHCGLDVHSDFDHCPRCGADMREREGE